MNETDFDTLIYAYHETFLRLRKKEGYHLPNECEEKEEDCSEDTIHCAFCNPFLIPFEKLPEIFRDRYRKELQALLKVLDEMGFTISLTRKEVRNEPSMEG